MAAVFPSSIVSITDPTSANTLNSPDHALQHQTENQNIIALEVKVGVDGSADTTSLDYLIKNASSGGGGHVQTANKGGTGQTSYNKGDMLAASSASVLAKIGVGTDGQVLVADSNQTAGVRWGSQGGKPTVTVFTSSVAQIWTKSSVLSYVVIEVQGAGGGGGGNTTNNNQSAGGGGGGYTRKVVAAASLPVAASVLVAGGGAGGVGTGGTGVTPVLTYFGSVLSATGGVGGAASGSGGVGGTSSIAGDITVPGQMGGASTTVTAGVALPGGDSFMGSGGIALGFDTAGTNGTNYGGGGNGASSAGPDRIGGNGADGVIIISEYNT